MLRRRWPPRPARKPPPTPTGLTTWVRSGLGTGSRSASQDSISSAVVVGRESNPRQRELQSRALPSELPRGGDEGTRTPPMATRRVTHASTPRFGTRVWKTSTQLLSEVKRPTGPMPNCWIDLVVILIHVSRPFASRLLAIARNQKAFRGNHHGRPENVTRVIVLGYPQRAPRKSVPSEGLAGAPSTDSSIPPKRCTPQSCSEMRASGDTPARGGLTRLVVLCFMMNTPTEAK